MPNLRDLIAGERRQWEEYGVVPGPESLRLVIDSLPELEIDRLDHAFLFVSIGLLLCGEIEDDDDRADLEFALSDLADILRADAEAQAQVEPMASVLGVAEMRLVGSSALQYVEDTVLHVARLAAGVGPEPTLYALLVRASRRSVEVVVKPGNCRVAALTEPSEALSSLSRWVASSD